MFFRKKHTIFYLQKDGATVYSHNHPDGIVFKYPEHSLKEQELINEEKIADNFGTFMAENLLSPNNCIIVLSSDIFSQKAIEAEKAEEQQKEVEKFIHSLNIEETKLIKDTFELESKKYVLATNKQYFLPFTQVLKTLEWTIVSIIPVSLFRDISDSKIKKDGLNQKELQEIHNNIPLVKLATIVNHEKSDISQGNTTSFSLSRNIIIILAVFMIFIGAAVFIYTQGISITLPFTTSKDTRAEVKPTPIEKPSPTAIPTEDDKEKLTVSIQNGTGITGQAGKIKTRVEKLGYSDIETSNAKEQEHTTSTLTFSLRVSKEYQDELLTDLKKIFSDVSVEPVTEEKEFDILIITGEED